MSSFGRVCMNQDGGDCCGLIDIFYASSRTNHLVVISVDALISVAFFFHFVCKVSSRTNRSRSIFTFSLPFLVSSLSWNGCLGLLYLSLGLWMVGENFRMGMEFTPLHYWLVLLTQGVTWVLISLVPIIIGRRSLKVWSLIVALFAGFLCISSILDIMHQKYVSVKTFLDICSLPGAMLLRLCSFKQAEQDQNHTTINDSLYKPLNGESPDAFHLDDSVTPFARAGFLSRMSFWWLNPLMHKGYEKPLEDNDIPQLGRQDRAESCYSLFLEKLNSRKQTGQMGSTVILWTIVSCHRKEILITGFLAVVKVLMLSCGPVLLKEFINVSAGKEAFRNEGYLLALGLFLTKLFESLSQRQWYFRSRRLGMQLRSLLSAAIFKKQLKLSNSAKLFHSSGEIMNYVTVDAYRIGEFPFWFHQTWSTSFQLCIALIILYNAIGLATISAMVVIILTVACNAPLAKLQHKFQSKLMDAQDQRLKAMSEALVYMKVLKLYAWETHFKKVIEGLREVESRWLSAFQLRRAYNSFLFWSSPVLVSAATFLTCYLVGIPLSAGNVFTFVATLRLVQDPVRQIPDVIGVIIQAKVAFTRIIKFLEAPELQNGPVRREHSAKLKHQIIINSACFSWDQNSVKPTLRNVNLYVNAGEKVAVCGEVGSGKSSLLAAILGEIPKTDGTVHVFGKIAYVSQNAWIQSGTVQDNILFGSPMDKERYLETLEKCFLVKDIEMLPFGDITEIGERGVNLSGGQKQRLQLARALYQDADIYLLDDPLSAVDAHTATSLFNEYVMEALSAKTVILVTHQVDFLPAFNSILVRSHLITSSSI